MPDGERGNQFDDGPQAVRPENDGDQKGNVVVTDQDVFDCRFARNCMRDPLLAQKTKSIHISASVNRG